MIILPAFFSFLNKATLFTFRNYNNHLLYKRSVNTKISVAIKSSITKRVLVLHFKRRHAVIGVCVTTCVLSANVEKLMKIYTLFLI